MTELTYEPEPLKIHRSLVVRLIRQYGSKEVLKNWTGTDEEAIKRVKAGPELIEQA